MTGNSNGESPSGAPVVLLSCADLLFAVQLQSISRAAGYRPVTVRPGEPLPGGAVLIVNLAPRHDWATPIKEAAERGLPIIAFGPHTDTESRQAAKQLGATRVLSNGNVARDLPRLLAEARGEMRTED